MRSWHLSSFSPPPHPPPPSLPAARPPPETVALACLSSSPAWLSRSRANRNLLRPFAEAKCHLPNPIPSLSAISSGGLSLFSENLLTSGPCRVCESLISARSARFEDVEFAMILELRLASLASVVKSPHHFFLFTTWLLGSLRFIETNCVRRGEFFSPLPFFFS